MYFKIRFGLASIIIVYLRSEIRLRGNFRLKCVLIELPHQIRVPFIFVHQKSLQLAFKTGYLATVE
jgi:hypothetical protein